MNQLSTFSYVMGNLHNVVIYDYNNRNNVDVWQKRHDPFHGSMAARKDFEGFPMPVQTEGNRALTIAAEGRKADNVKPLRGFDNDIMEIVLRHRGDAFRVIYAVQIGEDLWVIHAFQKKSKEGIKTPKHEIDLMHERLKRLKEIQR